LQDGAQSVAGVDELLGMGAGGASARAGPVESLLLQAEAIGSARPAAPRPAPPRCMESASRAGRPPC